MYLFARNHEHDYFEDTNFRVDLFLQRQVLPYSCGFIFADVKIIILCGLIFAVAKNVMFMSSRIIRGKTNFCKVTKDFTA